MSTDGFKAKITYKAVVSAALLFLLVLSLAATSLAWFTLSGQSGKFGFTAGGRAESFPLYIGTVATGADEASRIFELCENGLVGINAPTETAAGTNSYKIDISDMQFGTIDNLSKLKAENVIYLRLEIKKSLGSTVNLMLANTFDENGYFCDVYKNIYDAGGENSDGNMQRITGETEAELEIINGIRDIQAGIADENGAVSGGESFLEYSYAFSAEKFDGAISEGGGFKFAEELTALKDASILTLKCPEDVISTESDTYYLYIKITPNLNAFAYSIEYLTDIMPCYMLFGVTAEFEISEEVSE